VQFIVEADWNVMKQLDACWTDIVSNQNRAQVFKNIKESLNFIA
jgi:hypothetical protein